MSRPRTLIEKKRFLPGKEELQDEDHSGKEQRLREPQEDNAQRHLQADADDQAEDRCRRREQESPVSQHHGQKGEAEQKLYPCIDPCEEMIFFEMFGENMHSHHSQRFLS